MNNDEFDINDWIPAKNDSGEKPSERSSYKSSMNGNRSRGSSDVKSDKREYRDAVVNIKTCQILGFNKKDGKFYYLLKDVDTQHVATALLPEVVRRPCLDPEILAQASLKESILKLKILEGSMGNIIIDLIPQPTPSVKRNYCIDRGNSFEDYICVQKFSINIIKTRTVMNDGYVVIPDRIGGRLRTFYKVGSDCEAPSNPYTNWWYLVTQEGQVFDVPLFTYKMHQNTEFMIYRALKKLAGFEHSHIKKAYWNLIREINPDKLGQAFSDGLESYEGIANKLLFQGKSLDCELVHEFSDEIEIKPDFIDGLVCDDLFTVHYHMSYAEISADPELKNLDEILFGEDHEKILHCLEQVLQNQSDISDGMAVVGLKAKDNENI